MKQAQIKAAPLVLALLAAGVVGGAGVEMLHRSPVNAATQPAIVAPAIAPPAATPVPPVPTASTLPDFPRITERYGPAVVNISVSGTRKTSGNEIDPEAMSDPFEL